MWQKKRALIQESSIHFQNSFKCRLQWVHSVLEYKTNQLFIRLQTDVCYAMLHRLDDCVVRLHYVVTTSTCHFKPQTLKWTSFPNNRQWICYCNSQLICFKISNSYERYKDKDNHINIYRGTGAICHTGSSVVSTIV